jgi:hypothetical protein
MFCEWDKDLELRVVKQEKGTKAYELDKDKPYTIRRIYNGTVVGYLGEFSSRGEAEIYLVQYATS